MDHIGGYPVQGVLGSGGFGTVYLGSDPATGGRVAIKLLDHPGQQWRRAMFHQEVAAMRAVEDPHVVRVLDVLETDDVAAIVTDYVEGASLRTVLDTTGPLDGRQALAVLHGALSGLLAVHRAGLVHADLKPDNILLDRSGTSRLIDFGLAGRPRLLSGPDTWSGTPSYIAPEVVAGSHIDARSDLYAAGAILFELLVGQVPFRGANQLETVQLHLTAPVPDPLALRPDLAPELAILCRRDLAKQPDQRHPDAAWFLHDLDRAARERLGPEWSAGAGLGALVGTALGTTPAWLGMLGGAAPLTAGTLGGALGGTAGGAAGLGAGVAAGSSGQAVGAGAGAVSPGVPATGSAVEAAQDATGSVEQTAGGVAHAGGAPGGPRQSGSPGPGSGGSAHHWWRRPGPVATAGTVALAVLIAVIVALAIRKPTPPPADAAALDAATSSIPTTAAETPAPVASEPPPAPAADGRPVLLASWDAANHLVAADGEVVANLPPGWTAVSPDGAWAVIDDIGEFQDQTDDALVVVPMDRPDEAIRIPCEFCWGAPLFVDPDTIVVDARGSFRRLRFVDGRWGPVEEVPYGLGLEAALRPYASDHSEAVISLAGAVDGLVLVNLAGSVFGVDLDSGGMSRWIVLGTAPGCAGTDPGPVRSADGRLLAAPRSASDAGGFVVLDLASSGRASASAGAITPPPGLGEPSSCWFDGDDLLATWTTSGGRSETLRASLAAVALGEAPTDDTGHLDPAPLEVTWKPEATAGLTWSLTLPDGSSAQVVDDTLGLGDVIARDPFFLRAIPTG